MMRVVTGKLVPRTRCSFLAKKSRSSCIASCYCEIATKGSTGTGQTAGSLATFVLDLVTPVHVQPLGQGI